VSELAQGSLFDLPLRSANIAAVASTGVFTHGHAAGEAFAELARALRLADSGRWTVISWRARENRGQ